MNEKATIDGATNKPPGVLLSLSLLVLLVLLAYLLVLSFRDQVRTAEISTHNIAAVFETRLDATLRRADADLQTLSIELPDAALKKEAVERYEKEVNASLERLLFNVEEIVGYRVHDAEGNLLYTTGVVQVQCDRPKCLNVSGRDYFTQLRDGNEFRGIFSDVLTDRRTGREVLVIARPLLDEEGRFLGIVRALLGLDFYKKQFQSLDLGRNGVIALRRKDTHALVARWPEQPDEVNRSVDRPHPFGDRPDVSVRDLAVHYATYSDNTTRIVGVQVVKNYPFYFSVGLSRDEVLDGWYTQVIVVACSALVLISLVGTLLLRLWRMRIREAGILNNLARSESKFRELAQMVPVGICHFDSDGRCTYVNGRYMALVGRTWEETMGSGWLDFVHPSDRGRVQDVWRRAGKDAVVCEYRIRRPGGQLVHVIGEVHTQVDADGAVRGYIVAQTDISARKQAEAAMMLAKQEAESANLAKTRFLAAASHDLRQPIQAINLFRDALDKSSLNSEQKTISRFLSMSVRALGDLLYSLLDISKLDAGMVKPQKREVLLESFFQSIDDEFSTLAGEKSLRFKLYYPVRDVVLRTDPGLLLSVLRNLIDNAFKYTEHGGVLVGFRRRGNEGVIQVWDTGIGIDAKYGEQIFDECFQIGNPLRDRTQGLGIGLAIVRRPARLLGGEVTYRSRLGVGSVFEVRLPDVGDVSDETRLLEADSSALSEDDYSSLRGWRVVVIEDDYMVAKSIELSLSSMGVRVQWFASATEALENPDLLGADFYISDFSLPGLNGLRVLDTIQSMSARPINAVLMTGETSPERIALTTSSQWTVLFKPADLAKLLAAMKAVTSAPLAGETTNAVPAGAAMK